MHPDHIALRDSEEYTTLVNTRASSKWLLTFLMLFVYYGFILIIAFAPDVFAMKIGLGHMSLGILSGLGVIIFSFVVTGIYVRKANEILDPLTHQLHERAAAMEDTGGTS